MPPPYVLRCMVFGAVWPSPPSAGASSSLSGTQPGGDEGIPAATDGDSTVTSGTTESWANVSSLLLNAFFESVSRERQSGRGPKHLLRK